MTQDEQIPGDAGPTVALPWRHGAGRKFTEVSHDGITTRHGLTPWEHVRALDALVIRSGHGREIRSLRMRDSTGRVSWLAYDHDEHPPLDQWLPVEWARRNPEAAAAHDQTEFEVAGRTPWATRTLVLITALITAWEFLTYGTTPSVADLSRAGGVSIGAVANGAWWKLGVSNFLHGSLLHVGLNLFVSLLLGNVIERRYGWRPIVAIAIFASLLSGIGSIVIGSGQVSIGESGIGFGLMAFAFAVDPRLKTEVGGVGLQMLALNVINTFVAPNISVGGHVGGLVAGLMLGLLWIHQPGRAVGIATIVVPAVLCAALWSLPQWDRPLADGIATRVVGPKLEHSLRANLAIEGTAVKVKSARCKDVGDAPHSWSCRIDVPSAGGAETEMVSFDDTDQWRIG